MTVGRGRALRNNLNRLPVRRTKTALSPRQLRIVVPWHHRQLNDDTAAFAHRASNAALSAQQSCPLSDAFQAEMILRNGLWVKAYAPITNLDPNMIPVLQEADPYSLALAVLAGIRQALLGNPVDGVFQGLIQSVKINFAVELDFRPSIPAFFMDKVGDGFHNT